MLNLHLARAAILMSALGPLLTAGQIPQQGRDPH